MRYEKGRKDASRRRIIKVAGERFRGDGIAATGLASIMGEAGLTNGAFYPHFQSKAELVGESVAAALGDQTKQLQEILASGGLDLAISSYLSAEHRDNPAEGCTLAALLPELARQPSETRSLFADRLLDVSRQVSAALPPDTRDRELWRSSSKRRSSAPFSSLAPFRGRHCRIASWQRAQMRRGRLSAPAKIKTNVRFRESP